MIGAIQSWWKHLGYMKPNAKNIAKGFKIWGLRPWRGAPFYMLVIDVSNSAKQSEKHLADCKECEIGTEKGDAG